MNSEVLVKRDKERQNLITSQSISSTPTNKIICQTQRFKADIMRGTSVLLEVQAELKSTHLVCCEWQKDGHTLRCDDRFDIITNHYCESVRSILCLCTENITAEGQYRCIIKHVDGELISEPIELTIATPIDQYTLSLLIAIPSNLKFKKILGHQSATLPTSI